MKEKKDKTVIIVIDPVRSQGSHKRLQNNGVNMWPVR